MATIDPLVGEAIRHSIGLQHYSNYALSRMVGVLNRTDSDLMNALSLALADVDASTFKVQRLDAMLASVRDLNAQAYAALRGELAKEIEAYTAYEAGYQHDMYTALTPVAVSFASVAPEAVYAAAFAKPFEGRLLKEWADGLEASRLRRIKDVISIGFTSGKTTAAIVSEIRGTKAAGYADGLLNVSRNDIDSIVRTALSHTAQLTRQRFYEDNESLLGDIVWISTLDSRTSSYCRARDHKHYTVEHKSIDGAPAWGSGPGRAHFRCRSTSIAMLAGQKSLTGSRSSADGYVGANVTYSEWLKAQTASVQDEVLGKAKGARYRADGMSDAAFVNDRGIEISLKTMRERDARAFGA